MDMQLSDWVENIVEKEKLLATSNFSFSHNVFKSCLLLILNFNNPKEEGFEKHWEKEKMLVTSIFFFFSPLCFLLYQREKSSF